MDISEFIKYLVSKELKVNFVESLFPIFSLAQIKIVMQVDV